MSLIIRSLNIDLTYKFDLSDATCVNYPLKFSSDAAEGTNATVILALSILKV